MQNLVQFLSYNLRCLTAGLPYDSIQYTLVDCPGHASLIRTIIGGTFCFSV